MAEKENRLSSIAASLLDLFYPRLCPACSSVLMKNESLLCLKCRIDFPETNFHRDPDNDVARLFWGRVKIENAASFFFYRKGSRFQNIIFEMKYRNQKQLAVDFGKWYGNELLNTPFCKADFVHAVPLHYIKQKRRGYNQSELIASGFAEAIGIPLKKGLIERSVNTDTQTRKSHYDRWLNVEGIFRLKNESSFVNRHVLLVDDVVTTGSTLEACASAILSAEGARVSIVTLACAVI